ncbi:hypothetical protein [Robiginitalea sp.]|jgi:hypothetical protein|uniref:hypothetical protein n=1 Tax=Robiginitalea sp. TaxID=1902411 RepID=UPI003C795D91
MKNLLSYCRPLWFFHKRIALPALFISVLLGLALFRSIGAAGLIFLMMGPLWHYYIYEVRYKQEYYFYFNLGFTRLSLWVSTLILVAIVFFTALLL